MQERSADWSIETLLKKYRLLGCFKPDYFNENYEGVLSNKLSLVGLLKESEDHSDLERTVGMIGNYGGLDDIKNLKKFIQINSMMKLCIET